MVEIKNVAVFGASGNFGKPITTALLSAGFSVTVFTRPESSSVLPAGVRDIIRADYADVSALTEKLQGQDAVVNVTGPGAIGSASAMVEAAYHAGVKRFIINDFGWGINEKSLPEFKAIGGTRKVTWDLAVKYAEEDRKNGKEDGFTWTGITIGNPIDWALKKFPRMGFNLTTRRATIYDAGTEAFTGTTLEGIGQSVVGVLSHPAETANRFVKARSIKVSQNALLDAFSQATPSGMGQEWEVERSTTAELLLEGRRKHAAGEGGWILDLLVYQLFAPGEARCVVAPSREESDAPLLEIREESANEVAAKALAA
ncbi:NAD(P)-binding protein [Xylariaceae sp. FL0255]|nr:NAD(P)-binding protein [Xylariaceae sp. FL0255]